MPKPPVSTPRNRTPDRRAALAQYRSRANGYDNELALFEPLRREAVARLNLGRGDTVLDVGCGTGLSFALLDDAVGHQGRIVGWVINHRLSADTVRFTCSFMRKDLGRRGRIMPLYTVSLELLRAHGTRQCMFVTPVQYQTMVDFVKRRCAPWATFFGETRGAVKNLV